MDGAGGGTVVDHEVEAPFRHSTGPGLSRFFTALRDEGTLLGRRCDHCGTVVVPAGDFCETCCGELGDFVAVGPEGTITGFTVVHRPRPLVGLEPPFAFVRVRLDGASTELVHLARDVEHLRRGGRVRPVLATERHGTIRDIEHFVPAEVGAAGGEVPALEPGDDKPVVWVTHHLRLPYRFGVAPLEVEHMEAVKRGEILGVRCTSCQTIYPGPHQVCGKCWALCQGWEHVADTGTVVTYVVVNVPFYGQEVDIPYVLANIRLDGADASIQHLVGRINAEGRLVAPDEGMRTGMRVVASWAPAGDRRGFLNDDIVNFEPADEPDVAVEQGPV